MELLRGWIAQGPDQHGKDEALIQAAEHCSAEAVKLLLEAGASPKAEASGKSGARESTALTAAVGGWSPKDECLIPMLKLLLDADADPNRTDSRGTTPVELAARASVAATKLLLSRGADPRKARRSPLTRAVLAAHPELVPVLLERGVAVDRLWRQQGLHSAARGDARG